LHQTFVTHEIVFLQRARTHDLGAAPAVSTTYNLGAEGQPDGLALKLRGQQGSGVGVLTGQEPGIQADDRHLACRTRPKACANSHPMGPAP